MSVVLAAERSGLAALRANLDTVLNEAVDRRVDLAIVEAQIALRQVEQVVRAERDAADPTRVDTVMAELAQAKAQADLLNDPAAGWLVTLDDGMGDLRTDIDYDLAGSSSHRHETSRGAHRDDRPRGRVGRVRGVARATGDGRRRRDLPGSVDGRRGARGTRRRALRGSGGRHRCDPRRGDRASDRQRPRRRRRGSRRLGASQRGVLLLEGSWTGIEAFSMVGGLIGLSLLNPLSLVLGIFMGRRVLREEKQRQLASRREQARQSVSRYFEEVTFRVSKDVQDALRRIHRGSALVLRDECGRDRAVGHGSGPGRRAAPASRPPTRSRSTPSSRRCSSSPRVSRPPAADPRPRPGVRFVQDRWHRRVVRSSHDHSLQRHRRRRGRHGSVAGVLSPARARPSRLRRRPAACRGRLAWRLAPRLRHDRDHPFVRPELVATARAGIAWLSRSSATALRR